MKALIQKFRTKNKANQARENEVPLMMSCKDLELCLVEIKKSIKGYVVQQKMS